MKPFLVQFLAFVSTFLSFDCHAVDLGTLDNGRHNFAAFVAVPVAACNDQFVFGSCGGSLVNIEGLPENRTILGNGLCVANKVNAADARFYINFDENQVRIRDPDCGVIGYSTPGFTAKYYWTPYKQGDLQGFGLDRGQTEDNYAIILLEEPVPPSVAIATKITKKTNIKSSNMIPIVGFAGYGYQNYTFPGPRNKMYIEMRTTSVSKTVLGASIGGERPGICTGDYGGPIFDPNTFEVYAVASTTDAYCSGTAACTRVGTQAFYDWLDTVRDDINQKAQPP